MTPKGKIPAKAIWGRTSMYHGPGGIALGEFVVRKGVWFVALTLLPTIPQNVSNGKATRAHTRTNKKIVPEGIAAVAL